MNIQQLPHEYRARPLTVEDAAEVTRLCNLEELATQGKTEFTEGDAIRFMSMPGLDLEQNSLALLDDQGHMVGAVVLYHVLHIQFEPNLFVDPAMYASGIADYLLTWVEERSRALMSNAESDLRVTMGIGTNVKRTPICQAFERHGFRVIRHALRMGIALDAQPAVASWPEEVRLTTFEPGMERAIFNAEMEFFQDHWGFMPRDYEEWRHFNTAFDELDPSLYFLVKVGEDIVAMALCRHEHGEGWVHTLGVRRSWRRKGLALALLQQAFGEFYRRGIQHASLYVDGQSLTGATKLYARAGMHVMQQSAQYEKELRAGKELRTQTLAV
ncbi:GNAT family N-acetyltransferase [Ktedonobacter racemifer]|uniref:GCN5-related N-acetyltransferase n=1 Tax=Ktedonobacter racemifer DSM 44963 TaxID=485913 RepID=D6TKJ7_KTERA|nr:GNAT family N-acetyltransferase [Ktedonobacter racemifer]EFH86297.1 GCN5-related N-acetyltransferase [Ktedonobacter racemifer DSM 44963]